MKRILVALTAVAGLAACGDGNPFTGIVDDDGNAIAIPEAISSTVQSFNYNPAAGTLTLTGTLRDGDTASTTFTRKPGLDQGPYQAFTAQDDPLDEHTTVLVRGLGDVSAAVAVTGGQFTYYSGGARYGRTGDFSPPVPSEITDTGLVTYAGQYVGLTNLNGPNTDLQPVPAGVSAAVEPSQAGPVNGKIFINVSFDDNNVAGVISERTVSSEAFGTINVSNLVFEPGTLNADGSFSGSVELPGNRQEVGEYGGVIGANNGAAAAGGIFAEEHFGDDLRDSGGNPITITGEEEFGIFVLGRCGGPLADASPECSAVDP